VLIENTTSVLAFLGKLSADWRFLALSGSFLAAFCRFAGGFPAAFLGSTTSFVTSERLSLSTGIPRRTDSVPWVVYQLAASFLAAFRRFAGGFPAAFLENTT